MFVIVLHMQVLNTLRRRGSSSVPCNACVLGVGESVAPQKSSIVLAGLSHALLSILTGARPGAAARRSNAGNGQLSRRSAAISHWKYSCYVPRNTLSPTIGSQHPISSNSASFSTCGAVSDIRHRLGSEQSPVSSWCSHSAVHSSSCQLCISSF